MAKKKSSSKDIISLGKHIAKERQKRGISLETLATEMAISKGNLSDIENGKRDPRFSTLQAIAKGLGLKTRELIKNY
ncbi:MAG: helix-turn-helix transcriptional regulator [Bdellovibrionales bacterium]|nr:helix-turn-helix transcriptional regulator [Bdellovibrionales bacterium]NDD90798.1 XRE family transcriptional regulator [bacterium]